MTSLAGTNDNNQRPPSFEARLIAEMPTIRRHAASLTTADAEDLAGQTMLHALEKWQSFRADGNFSGWVYGLMKNLIKPQDTVPIDAEPSCEATQEHAVAIRQALAAMPDKQRHAVEMSAAGYSMREIAKVNGLSVMGARSRVARGRRAANDNEPARKVG